MVYYYFSQQIILQNKNKNNIEELETECRVISPRCILYRSLGCRYI